MQDQIIIRNNFNQRKQITCVTLNKNLNNKLEEKKKFYFIFCFSFNYFKLKKK